MMRELGGLRRGVGGSGDDAVIDVRGLRMRYVSVDVLRGVEFVARRESGSTVDARREKAMQRAGW